MRGTRRRPEGKVCLNRRLEVCHFPAGGGGVVGGCGLGRGVAVGGSAQEATCRHSQTSPNPMRLTKKLQICCETEP